MSWTYFLPPSHRVPGSSNYLARVWDKVTQVAPGERRLAVQLPRDSLNRTTQLPTSQDALAYPTIADVSLNLGFLSYAQTFSQETSYLRILRE